MCVTDGSTKCGSIGGFGLWDSFVGLPCGWGEGVVPCDRSVTQ